MIKSAQNEADKIYESAKKEAEKREMAIFDNVEKIKNKSIDIMIDTLF